MKDKIEATSARLNSDPPKLPAMNLCASRKSESYIVSVESVEADVWLGWEKVCGGSARVRRGDAARHTLFITGSPQAPPGTSPFVFFMSVIFSLSGRSCCQSCGRTGDPRAVEGVGWCWESVHHLLLPAVEKVEECTHFTEL